MDGTLTTEERVVTAEVLGRAHQGQTYLHLGPGSVLTPSGWDYVNQHRMEVVRGAAPPSSPNRPAQPRGPDPQADLQAVPQASIPAPDPGINEVLPAIAEETRIVQEGRCDRPDQACGCESEEFGSGFAESDDCTVRRMQQEGLAATCDGRDLQPVEKRMDEADVEALVRLVTDQVLARLREME